MNLRLTKRLIKEVSFGVPYQEKTRTIRNSRLFRSYREAAELVMRIKKLKFRTLKKKNERTSLSWSITNWNFRTRRKKSARPN
ncbi:MAG: hypothetical protein WDN75_04475 [Bacteroidota bacterium]